MAHGIEVRLPFLNHQLVEFIFSLPSEMKIRGGWTKWIARKSAEGYVPNEIIWRKEKIAYESPDNFLFKNRKEESVSSVVHSKELDRFFKKDIETTNPKLFFRKVMMGKMLR